MNNLENIFTKDIQKFSKNYFKYLNELLNRIDTKEIKVFYNLIFEAKENSKNIFFVGNGGSASTASHFANDLSIGSRSYTKPFKCYSLTDNNSIITAIGNDFGFDEVFSRQIKVLGNSGDLLVLISASGNSANLIKAIECAKEKSIQTIAITSFDGGTIKKLADYNVFVKTEIGEYGPAEDAHLILNHLIVSHLIRTTKDE